jgi:hypothetical protein
MKKFIKFLSLEICIFAAMILITLLEITHFNVFKIFFEFIKTPSSWFVGLGLAYAFSNLFQNSLFKFFSKRAKNDEEKRGDFFLGFLMTLIITALITPFIKYWIVYFFSSIFVYFHIILMQSIILLYILFKLKEGFDISGRYLLVNELIVLINILLVMKFIVN